MTTFLITAQSLGRYDSFFLTHNTRFQNFLTIIIDKLRSFCFLADHVKVCKLLMRPKFQKRSALKFDGRIIPEAKPSGINVGLIPRTLGRSSFGYPAAGGRKCSFFLRFFID